MGFRSWLKNQTERADPIGALASRAEADPVAPDDQADQEAWCLYLAGRGDSDRLDVLAAAWREYADTFP